MSTSVFLSSRLLQPFFGASVALIIFISSSAAHEEKNLPDIWGNCAEENVDGINAEVTNRDLAIKMKERAKDFLATLKPEQSVFANPPFASENRLFWHYFPAVLIPRAGMPLRFMSPMQQKAALDLLRAGLSHEGCLKVETIRSLEILLSVLEKDQENPLRRDPELYFLTIFGTPSDDASWGWRFEGHHVSLHWTNNKGSVVATTPQFLGVVPARVLEQVDGGPPVGTQVLRLEAELAHEFMLSLTAEQKKIAIMSDAAPDDILCTGTDVTACQQREVAIRENTGLAYDTLSDASKAKVQSLIEVYAAVMPPALAGERLKKIEHDGYDKIRFAWSGGELSDTLYYYRIQGPSFLIEFATTLKDPNHFHTLWRDMRGNDWGEDVLADHYRSQSHK